LIGGLGFIGKNLVTELTKSKRKITIVDTSTEEHPEIPLDINIVKEDFSNREFLEEFLPGVDELIYLAYATTPQTSFDDPISDVMRNLPSAITLFESAIKCKVQKLIYISSGGTIYGDVKTIPIPETAPTNPISPYGITKLTIEKYGLMYYRSKNLPIVILRPSNAYGIGQKPFTGQGFVATAIGLILTNKEIPIFGNKGTIRDYIYVADLTRAILCALDNGKIGAIYNVGTGVGRTNVDVLNCIKPLALADGYPVAINIKPERSFDVRSNVLDSQQLTNDTNWKIKVPFNAGIKKTWDWMKSYIENE
jgi:UDP-glucose 4-epimerase